MVKKIPVIAMSGSEGPKFIAAISKARQKRDRAVTSQVTEIIENVRKNGDKAVLAYTHRFDGVKLTAGDLRVTADEIRAKAAETAPQLKRALREAAKRIEMYHRNQGIRTFTIKTAEGTLSQRAVPIDRVAVYIPGGHTVYPSSVLMNMIPARIAGVPSIAAITPPRNGLAPSIAYALDLMGVTECYRIGGPQAVAALALGTRNIPAVGKIAGPGNAYVQTAKRLLYGIIDIDSVAGPSEVAIIADKTVNPSWAALDLLAQAEHGSGDEIALCITEDPAVASKIADAVVKIIAESEVRSTLEKLPSYAISVLVTKSRDESIGIVNDFAPEHLQIMTATARNDAKKVRNAAAVFIGQYTPVALGDYFIGTNHILPTGGAARFWSPVGVDSFLKRVSVAEVNRHGLVKAAPYVSILARNEKFIHHALSVERRVAGR